MTFKRQMTLLARLRRLHRCSKGARPMFEQLSKSVQGDRTFQCVLCGLTIILKNKSAL